MRAKAYRLMTILVVAILTAAFAAAPDTATQATETDPPKEEKTGELIVRGSEIVSNTLTAIAAAVVALAAVCGLNTWSREFIGKRNTELAEEVLELFLKAHDAMNAIRNPWGDSKEGEKFVERAKAEGRNCIPREVARALERYEAREDVFNRLQSLRYRFIARFGKENARPFDMLKDSVSKFWLSARMISVFNSALADTDDKQQRGTLAKQLHEHHANLTWGDEENDKVTLGINEAVDQMEKICRAIIKR